MVNKVEIDCAKSSVTVLAEVFSVVVNGSAELLRSLSVVSSKEGMMLDAVCVPLTVASTAVDVSTVVVV